MLHISEMVQFEIVNIFDFSVPTTHALFAAPAKQDLVRAIGVQESDPID